MRLTNLLAAMAMVSMTTAPAFAANANPAAKLSLASTPVRAGAPIAHANNATGKGIGNKGYIIGGVVVAAAVILAVSLGGNDKRASP